MPAIRAPIAAHLSLLLAAPCRIRQHKINAI
jgi:hypothetical protein